MRTPSQQFICNVGLSLLAVVSLLMGAAGQGPGAPTNTPAATATINGTVTTAFGGPVPRARVTLRPATAINQATGVATDATGRFSFPDLLPGVYFLRPEKSGYSPAMSRALPGFQVRVAAGETANVALQLKHAVAIVGRVLDENGDPLHATVNVHYFESLAAQATSGNRNYGIAGFSPYSTVYAPTKGATRKPGFANAAFAETGDRGEFRIHSLPPGRYFLRIDSSANGKAYAPLYYPAGPLQEEREGLLLNPGDEVPLNFNLQPEPSSVVTAPSWDRTPATISGRVVSADRQPLAQAEVRLACGAASRRTATDGAGRFEFADIPPGGCQVDAFKPGYAPDPNNFYLNFQSLAPGERVEHVAIKLHAIAAIVGRILDENGDPLEGAEVAAFPFDAGKVHGDQTKAPRTVTDEQGRFRVHSLPPGQYLIGVNVPATQTAGRTYLPTYYPGTPMPRLAAPVSLRTGDEFRIELLMRPMKGATVRGRVNSLPGERFSLVLERKPTDEAAPFFRSAYTKAATIKPDNSFEIANVPPGKYVARAFVGSGVPRIRVTSTSTAIVSTGGYGTPAREGRADVEVALADVNGVVITLGDPEGIVTISGTMRCECPPDATNLRGGFGLREVPARPFRMDAFPPAVRFSPEMTFTIGVPVGRWQVGSAFAYFSSPTEGFAEANVKSVTLGGRDVTTEAFEVTRGSAGLRFDVLLNGFGARIDGVVLDSEGKPVIGANVYAIPTDKRSRTPEKVLWAATNWKGEFTIKSARPGEYILFAFAGPTHGLDDVLYGDEEWVKQHASAGHALKAEEKQRYSAVLHAIVE